MAATTHPSSYEPGAHDPRTGPFGPGTGTGHGFAHGFTHRPSRPHLRLIHGGAEGGPSERGTLDTQVAERRSPERARVRAHSLRVAERRRAVRIALVGAACWLVLLAAGLAGAARPDVDAARAQNPGQVTGAPR